MPEIKDIIYSNTHINVHLDTGESLQLAPEAFNIYSLSSGKIIDNTLYQQLKEESMRFNCRQKALNYLAIRSRSYHEMRTYLMKKGFPKDIIEEILMRFKENGYIDDFDFAVRFINAKKKAKVIGKNLLKRDLYKKGVSREIINSAIKETASESADPEDIFELALKKMKSLEKKKNKTQKIIYFLRQKGFDENEIRSALDRLKIEEVE